MLPNALPPTETDHVPVLAEEVRGLLAVQPGETVVDATFGAGGHAGFLAADLRGSGKLIAIDRDPGARAQSERPFVRSQPPTKLVLQPGPLGGTGRGDVGAGRTDAEPLTEPDDRAEKSLGEAC